MYTTITVTTIHNNIQAKEKYNNDMKNSLISFLRAGNVRKMHIYDFDVWR